MIKVVTVSGAKDSGKDDFKRFCYEKLKQHRYITVRWAYDGWAHDIASYCGCQVRPSNMSDATFVSAIHRALIAWDAAVLKDFITAINAYYYTDMDHVIFIDVDDRAEVAKLQKTFNATTLAICRPGDQPPVDGTFDYIIWNKSALELEADKFIIDLLKDAGNTYEPEEP